MDGQTGKQQLPVQLITNRSDLFLQLSLIHKFGLIKNSKTLNILPMKSSRNSFPVFYRVTLIPLFFFLLPSCSDTPKKPDPVVVADSLQNPTFLFLSDIHLNTFDTVITYGDDTGLQLWKNFLAKADSVLSGPNAPNFIVYTGDLPAHYSCEPSCYLGPNDRTTHNANLKAILNGLRMIADKHHKPLFYLPGNNDGLAGDYYSFADEKQQTPLSLVEENTNPFPALNILPGTDKAPCLLNNPHPAMGYYAAMPVKGLRLIALNTVMFSKKFQAVDGSSPDTDRVQEMAWLAAQLKDASDKGDKVYIAMHIPPGLDAYSGNSMWDNHPLSGGTLLNQFLALTGQYRLSIAGILYGHTHMDEMRRLFDSTGVMTEAAVCCPGVTPQHSNNPGFKIVEYDKRSKELMNFTTFYTLPEGSCWGSNQYSFRSSFGITDNRSIYEALNAMPFQEIVTNMDSIYMVKHGMPGYNIAQGIDVKYGQ